MNRSLLKRSFQQVLVWSAVVVLSAVVAQAQDTAAQTADPQNSGPGAAAQGAQRTDGQIEMDVVHALDASQALKNDLITAATIQSEVTLSGTVSSDASKKLAESIASQVAGVTKVHNNLQVGNPQDPQNAMPQPADQSDPGQQQANGQPGNGQPDNGPMPPPQAYPQQTPPQAQYPPDQGQYPPQPGQYPQQGQQPGQYPNQGQYPPQQGPYPQQQGQYPSQQGPYPQQQGQYPPQQGPYPQQQGQYPPQRPQYAPYPYPRPYPQQGQQPQGYNQPPAPAYRPASGPVTVTPGTLLQLRTSEFLTSKRAKDGEPVQFTLISDVTMGGVLAIPRGATVHGVVSEVKKVGAGDLGGSPVLALTLTSLDLGGQNYPLTSDQFKVKGPNKAGETVSNAVGAGLVGTIIGCAVGRGEGCAIGAGAGIAAGTAASAASPGPGIWIPAEALVTFHIKDPLTVNPVSPEEAARLAQGLYQGGSSLYRRGYPSPYGPRYYAGYAYPYGYPPVYYRPYYMVGGFYTWR
jgi:hypothetical protein